MLIRHKLSIRFFVVLATLVTSAHFGEALAQPQRRSLPAPAESMIPKDPVELPMRRFNRLPAIDATINGSGPFRLIVDTGAAGLVLKNEVVGVLGLGCAGRQGQPQQHHGNGKVRFHLGRFHSEGSL